MKNHENTRAAEPQQVPIQIHRVSILELEEFILTGDQPQRNGHPTAGYSLAVLTKDPSEAYALLLHHIEPDAKGNYDLADVAPRSIMMWTPVEGGSPEYGAIVEVYPHELNYVPTYSLDDAWDILGLDQQ